MFSFMDLCGKPVAAADYIALCAHFHTLVLKGVPVFKGSNRQEGYRSAAPAAPAHHAGLQARLAGLGRRGIMKTSQEAVKSWSFMLCV